MQIHDLNTGTPSSGHYLALDSGTDTYKATPGNIKPAYTTGDSSTATSWTSVTAVATGLSFSTLINRITTMMKNVRYLYNVLGSSTFSTVASTITGAIGNTALGTTATTLSGAIAEHESDISTLNSKILSYTATRTVQWPYSLTANGNSNTNLYTLIENDLPASNRFLGLAGFTTGNVQVVPISIRYSDSVYSLQIRNLSNSEQTGTVTIYYICGNF